CLQYSGVVVDKKDRLRIEDLGHVSCLTGTLTQNVAPPSALLTALMLPRCAATMDWQIASPMPMPPSLLLQNASNTFLRSSAAMPDPLSTTYSRTCASDSSVRIVRFRSFFSVPLIASAALRIR